MKLKPGVTIMLAGVSEQDYNALGEACIYAGANVGEFPSASQRESMAAFGWSQHNNAMYHYCVKPAADTCHIVTVDQALGRTDNGWHERGHLPPVGCEIEVWFDDGRVCWHRAYVVGHKRDEKIFAASLIENHQDRLIWAESFRPLKIEREKFVERFNREWHAQDKTIYEFAADQYDKGLRYVD